MAIKFQFSDKQKKKIEEMVRNKAIDIVHEIQDKMETRYKQLISIYYSDYTPRLNENGKPYYERTYQLYDSYKRYYKNSHNTIFYGGITITGSGLRYYDRHLDFFSGERLVEKYIAPTTFPSATWHGGDWHGGYGEMASFSIYEEMIRYRDELIKEYS